MRTYFETIDELLLKKIGKRACELGYMELPEEDEKYDITLCVGNIHLVAGRIRTKRQADRLVNKFLKTRIP